MIIDAQSHAKSAPFRSVASGMRAGGVNRALRLRRGKRAMTLKVSRRGRIAPFIVMDVLRAANERAAAGADILHLEIGQPSTPAPPGVLAAARRALDRDALGYTDTLGLPALRRAIAAHYARRYGVAVDPRAGRRHHRLVGRVHPGLSRRLRAGRPGGAGGARLSRLPQHPDRARPRAGRAADRAGRALPADARSAAPRTATLDGLDRREPRQSDRHHDRRPTSWPPSRAIAHARGIRLVSDEIYHGIVYGMRGDHRARARRRAPSSSTASRNIIR